MKVSYKELLDSLGVEGTLDGYQTQPWQVFDEDSGETCSAEVRVMDGQCDEIEAEVMMQRDKSEADKPKLEIVLWMQAHKSKTGQYTIQKCRFQGKDYVNKVSVWDEKVCKFFKACVKALKKDKIPDFEQIIKDVMDGDAWNARGTAGGGKSPKIKTNQLVRDAKRGGAGF